MTEQTQAAPHQWQANSYGTSDLSEPLLSLRAHFLPAGYHASGMCSAKASVVLDAPGAPQVLVEKQFQAFGEAVVKQQVEEWMQQQRDRLQQLLATELSTTKGAL